jgi:hypothetical protein
VKREPIPVEQRWLDREQACAAMSLAAEEWLEQRARHGAGMPRKYDLALDFAMSDYRRAQRRFEEAVKRESRAA